MSVSVCHRVRGGNALALAMYIVLYIINYKYNHGTTTYFVFDHAEAHEKGLGGLFVLRQRRVVDLANSV